jgi:acyl-CoA thioesterase FadM
MQKENRGVAGVEQHIEYKRELRAGDMVTVCSAVDEVKDSSSAAPKAQTVSLRS